MNIRPPLWLPWITGKPEHAAQLADGIRPCHTRKIREFHGRALTAAPRRPPPLAHGFSLPRTERSSHDSDSRVLRAIFETSRSAARPVFDRSARACHLSCTRFCSSTSERSLDSPSARRQNLASLRLLNHLEDAAQPPPGRRESRPKSRPAPFHPTKRVYCAIWRQSRPAELHPVPHLLARRFTSASLNSLYHRLSPPDPKRN